MVVLQELESIRISVQSVAENLSILLPLSSILRGNMVVLQEVEQTYWCPKCSKGFINPIALVEHIERDHGILQELELSYRHPKCSRGFIDPVALVEHIERDHGDISRA
ncbi:Zinc finger AN1 and C2H2 domain-containing stress-associated protein 11, partial [Cucurbita argyrosperma subsp. sororia]